MSSLPTQKGVLNNTTFMSPWAPLKRCLAPGCPERALRGEARCAEHRNATWRHRESVTERGYGAAWVRLRKWILARDSGLCRVCGAPARMVDHVKPKSLGGTDDEANLRAICKPCHARKTGKEGRAAQR